MCRFCLWCQDPVEARRLKGVQSAVRQALSKKDNNDDADRKPSNTMDCESSENEDDFEASMRKKVLEKRARLSDSKGAGVSSKKKGVFARLLMRVVCLQMSCERAVKVKHQYILFPTRFLVKILLTACKLTH